MTLNNSIHYKNNALYCDEVDVSEIVNEVGTPTYIYSLKRILDNLHRIQNAFVALKPHIHYSAKANGNLTILRTLIQAGVGIDAVSGGEIHRALLAGAKPQDIVFAGVGKSKSEIEYAIEKGFGWFNVENEAECQLIQEFSAKYDKISKVALRLNPQVSAQTHPNIATGHGGAKFGLTAEVIQKILASQNQYPNLEFAGIHIHIGSQLHDTQATKEAVEKVLELIEPYPKIQTINIGGGLPAQYHQNENLPSFQDFANQLQPILEGYQVILEPGRSIVADAGIFVCKVLYIKKQAGQIFAIVDGSMTELIRPMLYQAKHDIVLVHLSELPQQTTQLVGPVCETTDVLAKDIALPPLQIDDLVAILTTGAYGMVMASNYNARPRPPEVVVQMNGQTWEIARKRETWDDLLRHEQ